MTAKIYKFTPKTGAINPARSGIVRAAASARHALDVAGDGVQAHSKGDLYPCIIAVIERYNPSGEFISRSYELSYQGCAMEYASYTDAEMVARAILAGTVNWVTL